MRNDLLNEARDDLDARADLRNFSIGMVIGTLGGAVLWLMLILSFGG